MIEIMKREIVCALGCTEPSAVALAVAKARETLGKAPEKVLLQVSGNILKNAMSVGIPGLICDGAKAGCALKIATSVAGAIQCAYLALEEVEVPEGDGIVCESVEDTIRNLGNLGNNGMRATDHVILDMMLAKG